MTGAWKLAGLGLGLGGGLRARLLGGGALPPLAGWRGLRARLGLAGVWMLTRTVLVWPGIAGVAWLNPLWRTPEKEERKRLHPPLLETEKDKSMGSKALLTTRTRTTPRQEID